MSRNIYISRHLRVAIAHASHSRGGREALERLRRQSRPTGPARPRFRCSNFSASPAPVITSRAHRHRGRRRGGWLRNIFSILGSSHHPSDVRYTCTSVVATRASMHTEATSFEADLLILYIYVFIYFYLILYS